eukprot:jgi/Hompol1/6482/HPOL_005014-RA
MFILLSIIVMTPLLTLLAGLLALLYMYCKSTLLPQLIQRLVRELQVGKELVFESIELKAVTDMGLQMAVALRVLGTRPPFNLGCVSLRLLSPLRIYDGLLGDLWAEVLTQSPIVFGGPFGSVPHDLHVNIPHLEIILAEPLDNLKQVVRKVSIGGQKELDRIVIRVEFLASVDLFGLMLIEDIQLTKTVNLGELQALEAEKRKKRQQAEAEAEAIAKIKQLEDEKKAADEQQELNRQLQENGSSTKESGSTVDPVRGSTAPAAETTTGSTAIVPSEANSGTSTPRSSTSSMQMLDTFITKSSGGVPVGLNETAIRDAVRDAVTSAAKDALTGFNSLIPVPVITPQPVVPQMRSITGGLDFVFPRPPSLNCKFRAISFQILFNNGKVAEGTIRGLEMSNQRADMKLALEVVPAVVSAAPFSGLASTAKGMLRGVAKGALNGLLYGEWGAGATVIGLSEIKIENEEGQLIPWLEELLSVIEFEYDLDAVRQFGSTAKEATSSLKESLMQMAASVIEASKLSGYGCRPM